jgi:Cdc6-like AAA superfamily ATPase
MDLSFKYWKEIMQIIEKGRMTDKIPYLKKTCRFFWETGNYKPLQGVLLRNPWILTKAKRNVAEMEDHPFWPPPLKQYEIEIIKGQYQLGIVNPRGDLAGMNNSCFVVGLFISGAQGTGKTYPILKMMDQMLKVPSEERGFNIITIQRIKHDADAFALKYPWFKILGWRDLRYNMWQVDDWDDPENKIASACTIFAGENFLYSLTVPALRYAVKKCYMDNGVFNGSKNFPVYREILSNLPLYLKEYKIPGYDMTNSIGRLGNRLVDFMEERDILNCKNGFTTSFFLEHDLCINVMDENEFTVRTTLLNIFYDIQRYLQSDPHSIPDMRILVIIDEARWLFDISRDKMDIPSNKVLESWFTSCRESGFGRIIITQEPGSVSKFVTSNCGFRWSFPVFGKESMEAVGNLNNLTAKQARYIMKLPRFGSGIFSYPGFDRPFIIQVSEGLDLNKSVAPEEAEKTSRPFIEKQHALIEAQQPVKTKTYTEEDLEEIRIIIHSDTWNILEILQNERFLHHTALLGKAGVGQNKFKFSIDWLEKQGFLLSLSCKSSKTKDAIFYPLTEKAHDLLKTEKSRRKPSPERFKHTYYCEIVKHWHEAEGLKAIREYSIGDDFIDVFIEQNGVKTAFEITLSFSNLEHNIMKCFVRMGIDHLFIVCENKGGMDRAERIFLESRDIPDTAKEQLKDKIHFIQIGKFL